MRHQVRGFIERKLQRSVSEASEAKEQSEFSTLASIKVLMSDVDSVKSDLRQLHEVKRMGERKRIFLGWGSARVGMRLHARDRMVLDHLYSHGCTNILSIFAPTHTSSLRSLFFLLLLCLRQLTHPSASTSANCSLIFAPDLMRVFQRHILARGRKRRTRRRWRAGVRRKVTFLSSIARS